MRKIILLFSVFMLPLFAFAQFSLGVKAGYNTSLGLDQNWKYNASSVSLENDIANGFHLGVYARIGRSLYVQPELLYNMDIYKQTLQVGEISTSAHYKTIKASTFDVPVLLGYSIINTNFFKFRVMAGPKFRFNCGSTKVEEEGVKVSAKPVQVGLDAGLGIDVWRLNLDVRYNLIGNLYKYATAEGEKLNTNPNNAFTVSLGFRIFGNNGKK